MQLILANVYHIDAPTGNISLRRPKRQSHPYIASDPLAYGDNHEGYRIVGTNMGYVEHYGAELADGGWWDRPSTSHSVRRWRKPRADLGDTFLSAHGLTDQTNIHTNRTFTVVGVMEPSGTVDQLILTSIQSIWDVHAHEEKRSIPARGKSPPCF